MSEVATSAKSEFNNRRYLTTAPAPWQYFIYIKVCSPFPPLLLWFCFGFAPARGGLPQATTCGPSIRLLVIYWYGHPAIGHRWMGPWRPTPALGYRTLSPGPLGSPWAQKVRAQPYRSNLSNPDNWQPPSKSTTLSKKCSRWKPGDAIRN